MSRVNIGTTLFAATLLIAACIGDPPVLGEYVTPACVADTENDPANCGACGNSCGDRSNAVGRCTSGHCELVTCTPGYLDCDGDEATGCEINVASDPSNCGSCKHPCNSGLVCMNGICTAAIPVSTSFASPSSPGGLLIVPRPIAVSLGGVGTTTIHYSTDGTDPSSTAASPISIPSLPTTNVDKAFNVLRWYADNETPHHAMVFQLDSTTTNAPARNNGYIIEGFRFTSSGSQSHVIEASAGASLIASATIQVWSPSSARVQVVYGFDATPVDCFFDTSAPPYGSNGGISVSSTVNVVAPTTSGLHIMRADLRSAADCQAAQASSFGAAAIDIGAVVVK
ncbi:MAG: hypothetical protein FWD69_02065 [Polyangiaceae bacterium]|nr:hypothetical protein [Polyangiaceae bacterium]